MPVHFNYSTGRHTVSCSQCDRSVRLDEVSRDAYDVDTNEPASYYFAWH